MSIPATSALPGSRTLAAYHQERAELYAALVGIFAEEARRRPSVGSGGRLNGASVESHRLTRATLEGVLSDPTLTDQMQRWRRSFAPLHGDELHTLKSFGQLAERCARALAEGDMASAADLWDAQSAYLRGPEGRTLGALCDELEQVQLPAYARAAGALRLLLEDDEALATLTANL